jgi:Zn-dependent peptidase ImmA (M78 family)
MDDISPRLSDGLRISDDTVDDYYNYFNSIIISKIKTKFLSHLVTSIEDLINEKRMKGIKDIIESAKEKENDIAVIKSLLAGKNARFYSLVLIPAKIRRRATTRYHKFGAIIYYNSNFEDKQIRILIAHELGHIVNKELLNADDEENTANLFAYIAMKDKNDFYEKTSKQYVFHSDIEILNEVLSVCATPKEK